MINLSCFVQLVQSSSPITQQGMMNEKQVDHKDIVKENSKYFQALREITFYNPKLYLILHFTS